MKFKLLATLMFGLYLPQVAKADFYQLVNASPYVGQSLPLRYSTCWSPPFSNQGDFFAVRQSGQVIQFVGFYSGGGGTICPGGQFRSYTYDVGEFDEGDYQLEIYRLFTPDGSTPIVWGFNNLPPVTETINFSVAGAPAAVPATSHFGMLLLVALSLLSAYIYRKRIV